MNALEQLLTAEWADQSDPSHDLAHVRRVVKNAYALHQKEGGDWAVIEPATWLHDLVNLPKNNPQRHLASQISADRAVCLLEENKLADVGKLEAIRHAIAAHSFSAGIKPETPEARILQDADRLDSLGAVGIARTFAVSGALNRPLFDETDPFAANRPVDDTRFALDHFEIKLFKIAETLHTLTARQFAQDRIEFMKTYMAQLSRELNAQKQSVPYAA